MKTIEQAKDEALLEIMGITDSQNSQDWIEVINRAMEIYLESYKQELREKLPSDDEITNNGRVTYGYVEFISAFSRGQKQLRDQVKELLK